MESTQIVSNGLISAAYVVAALLFIFSLAGLSKQETAKQGNLYGMIGMAIALLTTILDPRVSNVFGYYRCYGDWLRYRT